MHQAAKRRISQTVVLLATVLALAVALPAAASIPPLETRPSLDELAAQVVAAPPAPAVAGEPFRLYTPGEDPLAGAAPARFHLFAEAKTRVRGINLDFAPRVELHSFQVIERTGFALFGGGKSRRWTQNRHYDPEIGRFLQPDPLGYVDGPNVYQYGLNNPANFSDPMGLRAFTEEDKQTADELGSRIDEFAAAWEQDGTAEAWLLATGMERRWWEPGKMRPYWRWESHTATDQTSYLKIYSQLERDRDTFVAAVEEADDDGLIEYWDGGYYTYTDAERWENDKAVVWLAPIALGEILSMKAGRGGRGAMSVQARPGRRSRIQPRLHTVRSRLRDAGAVGLPGGSGESGPFRFRPREGYNPSVPLPRGPNGGYLDRFNNEWVRGPAHGKSAHQGYSHEWDVRLSPRGQKAWGQHAKQGADGTPYINVTPGGALSH